VSISFISFFPIVMKYEHLFPKRVNAVRPVVKVLTSIGIVLLVNLFTQVYRNSFCTIPLA